MTRYSRREINKAANKHLELGFPSINSFIKIIDDFRVIPDTENGHLELFSFRGKKIKAKRLNEELTMNLKQFSNYIEGSYNTITKAFERNKFQKGKHYFREGGQNVDPVNLTLLGVLKLLRHTRTGYADEFYDEVCEYVYYNMKPQTISEIKEKEEIMEILPDFTEEMKWRIAVLTRDKFTCQRCGAPCNSAHHIYSKRYLEEFNMDLWNIDNGSAICFDCHQKISEDGRKWFQ